MVSLLLLLAVVADVLCPTAITAPGHFSLPVVPQTHAGFVSASSGTATFFQDAAYWGSTGLLAHDYLSGREFYELHVGDPLVVAYATHKDEYVVTDLWYYFPTRDSRTEEEIFRRVYRVEGRLVLQTCWKDGYRFIIAERGAARPRKPVRSAGRVAKKIWQVVP